MKQASSPGNEATEEPETASSGASALIAGRYEVLAEIAGPGAGTTYKARHVLLESCVAVTVLPETLTRDTTRLARVQDAVRRACQLRHDHLVPVLDFGREEGRYHVVEALIEAEPLSALLLKGPLAPADALHVARQLADALAHAHARGVVHGAVSPASVLVEAGARPRALLSGLAIAELAWEAPAAALHPYATPERLEGKDADARTDVFALGLLVFEMLEGRPFLAGGEQEIRALLLESRTPLMPQFSRIAPAGVAGLVARALRRSPAERQQAMTQVREEIEACLRRLGQRSAAAVGTAAVQTTTAVPVRRYVARVVDDSAEEIAPGATADPAPDRPAAPRTAPAPRAASSPAPGARRSPRPANFPARVLARAMHGRQTSVGGMLLIAGVLGALGWPLLPDGPATPVGSEQVAAAPRLEPPAFELPGPPLAAPALPVPLVEAGTEPVPPATGAPAEVPPDAALVEESAAPEMLALATPTPARNLAPRIVSHRPRQREALGVTEGGSLAFSVRATDGNPGDRLAYAWFLDGRKVGTGPGWRLAPRVGTAGAAHRVEVQVTDAAGLKAPKTSWKVAVTARMTEANVRDWLGRLIAALERKDLATLRLYRVVGGEADAAAVRQSFPLFGRYRVSIANERIRTEGPYASVAFDLAEVDRGGRTRSSRRESYQLEKQANGFIALRAR